MWPSIMDFFTDRETFKAVVNASINKVRLVLFGIAALILSGGIPELTAALGKLGFWGSVIMAVLAAAMRSGDLTPPSAKALAYANEEQLAAFLKRIGVPDDVATTAAAKTATTAPPNV